MPYKDPEKAKAYRQKPEEKEKARIRANVWHENNRERHKETMRRRRKNLSVEDRERLYENKRLYNQRHPERRKNTTLKWKFGLTLDDYKQILKDQNNGCAICGKTQEEEGKALAVDHNHVTSQIRGLLCSNCNKGIGCFQENRIYLTRAIQYLNKYYENS